jgi:undecaprenyl diphosphate synthase
MSEFKTFPKHVAIIPDGNRRWAKQHGLIASMGHRKAVEEGKLRSFYTAAKERGVKCISLWGFSTENWKRSELEKKNLFEIFEGVIDSLSKDLMQDKIRFIHVGRKDRLPAFLFAKIAKLQKETESFDDFILCLALDYGGRDEILRATKKLQNSGLEATEENFSKCLDTSDLPVLDLVIRTGGDQRLSGFMPYQCVYSELLFLDKFFPDFNEGDLIEAIDNFGNRGRRFGK